MLEAACFDCGKYRTDPVLSRTSVSRLSLIRSARLGRIPRAIYSVPLLATQSSTGVTLELIAWYSLTMKSSTRSPQGSPRFCSCDVLFRGPRAFEIQEFATVCATGMTVCSTSLLAKLPILTVRFTKIHQHTHVLPTPHNVLPTPHIGNEHLQRRQLWARPYRQLTLTPSSIYLFDDWLTTSFV